ncbi:hypothetical protein FA95DRAFT_1476608, partial [Auriscalpium vulgare]
ASDEVESLPKFARDGWNTLFAPTLYSLLASSENPWAVISPSRANDAVREIQEIIDVCFPCSSYLVRWNDAIMKKRLYDKRSMIGKSALSTVSAFFKGKSEAEIKEYAAYALTKDGPALWKVPAPAGIGATSGALRSPVGLFESSFMADTLGPFLKLTQSSQIEYGHPTGGLALSAAAVERAFKSFVTGTKVDIGSFCEKKTREMVEDYV